MNIKKASLKEVNWALAAIIALLGFAGCDKEQEMVMMYGVISPDYTIKGAVVNKETKKPIAGIRVTYESGFDSYVEPYALTDAKGEFNLKLRGGFLPLVPVFIEDIDGEENGLFKSEQFKVDFSKAEYTAKAGRGEYTVNVNVELTEIKDE